MTIALLFLLVNTAYAAGNNQALTSHDIEMINAGFVKYLSSDFAGKYNDGYYTDPNPQSRGFDFWSNGKWATFDKDNNGLYETILEIHGQLITYVGTIDGKGRFIAVNSPYRGFIHRPLLEWVNNATKDS